MIASLWGRLTPSKSLFKKVISDAHKHSKGTLFVFPIQTPFSCWIVWSLYDQSSNDGQNNCLHSSRGLPQHPSHQAIQWLLPTNSLSMKFFKQPHRTRFSISIFRWWQYLTLQPYLCDNHKCQKFLFIVKIATLLFGPSSVPRFEWCWVKISQLFGWQLPQHLMGLLFQSRLSPFS